MFRRSGEDSNAPFDSYVGSAEFRQASAPADLQGQRLGNAGDVWADHREEGVETEAGNFDENAHRVASAGSALRAIRGAKAARAPDATPNHSPGAACAVVHFPLRRAFATIDGASDVATFLFRLADAARQSLVVDHDFSTGGCCPLIDALPPRTQLVVLQRSLAALLRPANSELAPLPASLFLEAPVYALVMHLLPLIEAEVEEQGDERALVEPRRGSSQRQHRQHRGDHGSGEEDDDNEAAGVAAANDEDWCQQRCFALALYELATAGAVPVRRDCRDLSLWRSLLAQAAAALLACPPRLVAALGSRDGPRRALEAVGLDGRALELYVSDANWETASAHAMGAPSAAVGPDELRWANLWIAALCCEDTAEATFFASPRPYKEGGDEQAGIASVAEAVALFAEAERSATEGQRSAADLVRAAEDALRAAGQRNPKLEERCARARARAAETLAVRAEQCGHLTQALALLLQLLAHQVNHTAQVHGGP
jgi:hypothetical protein